MRNGNWLFGIFIRMYIFITPKMQVSEKKKIKHKKILRLILAYGIQIQNDIACDNTMRICLMQNLLRNNLLTCRINIKLKRHRKCIINYTSKRYDILLDHRYLLMNMLSTFLMNDVSTYFTFNIDWISTYYNQFLWHFKIFQELSPLY